MNLYGYVLQDPVNPCIDRVLLREEKYFGQAPSHPPLPYPPLPSTSPPSEPTRPVPPPWRPRPPPLLPAPMPPYDLEPIEGIPKPLCGFLSGFSSIMYCLCTFSKDSSAPTMCTLRGAIRSWKKKRDSRFDFPKPSTSTSISSPSPVHLLSSEIRNRVRGNQGLDEKWGQVFRRVRNGVRSCNIQYEASGGGDVRASETSRGGRGH